MTKGTIQGQNKFLNNVAGSLGRKRKTADVERPVWKHQPQWKVLANHTPDMLVDVLEKQCASIHTDFVKTTEAELGQAVLEVIKKYEGKTVMTWDDERFREFGLVNAFSDFEEKESLIVNTWNTGNIERSVRLAEQADVGITFSDMTLAESGTAVLFATKGKARSVSLLPATYIAIIPKSTIVPRMSQATREIHRRVESGEVPPSCVNFITGPSNSADIEMNLVVGVHGPIKATYIVVDDK